VYLKAVNFSSLQVDKKITIYTDYTVRSVVYNVLYIAIKTSLPPPPSPQEGEYARGGEALSREGKY
jgi:hypothetical protein